MVTSSVNPTRSVTGIPPRRIGSRLDIDIQEKLDKSVWVHLDIDLAIRKHKEIENNMFNNTTILITGALGLLVRLLSDGYCRFIGLEKS